MSIHAKSEPDLNDRIVEVVVPVPLSQAFSYMLPASMASDVQRGCRVLVPFGNRHLQGVIVNLEASPPSNTPLKPVTEVLDTSPSFSAEMLQFTRWIADYYACTWGEALKAALPSGIEATRQLVVRKSARPNGKALTSLAQRIINVLPNHQGFSFEELRKAVPGTTTPLLYQLEEQGVLELELLASPPRMKPRFVEFARFKGPSSVDLKGSKQRQLHEHLKSESPERLLVSRLLKKAGASRASLTSLAKRGLVEIEQVEVIRTPVGELIDDHQEPKNPPPLHPAQREAVASISKSIAAKAFTTFLLQGVTGSGKTRVYIEALQQTLKLGKSAIVLVPEIALTPQTVRRFQAHFGDQIAVLHSRMSPGERFDAWRHIKKGTFRVVIGPRSAILAPVENLGLVVVDEEHETSYKQFDPAPRYHARDAAVMRASMNQAVCILGSATPSLESYVNAHELKKYTLLQMPERAPTPTREPALLPTVRMINLAVAKNRTDKNEALSPPLREAIQNRLDQGHQTILLQNRRGYAPVLECQECGWAPECADCAVTLTYHKAKRHLRCHYCGRTARPESVCPSCGSSHVALQGIGTQRVEEELESLFPEARVLRMDLDTTRSKNGHHKILNTFGRGEADILVGTQMVAKGLDFERVTLVGVINADAGLLLPDFRTDERTFQLLTQVAGRAGRAGLPGEVILQTRNPDHPVIRQALKQDIDAFAKIVLPQRSMLNYPPYGRMARVEFKGPMESKVARLATTWLRTFIPPEGTQVSSPQPAFLGRAKKLFRFQILLKASRMVSSQQLKEAIQENQLRHKTMPKGYRIAIDIDPYGLF